MGRGVGDGKSGQNRKPDAFLKLQRKIKISIFFSNFFGLDFFGPEIGPRNFGRVEGAPPTSRVGTSGPGRVRDEKSGQNRKSDAFLKTQRKIKKSTFFSLSLVPIFSDPKFGRVVGGAPPPG